MCLCVLRLCVYVCCGAAFPLLSVACDYHHSRRPARLSFAWAGWGGGTPALGLPLPASFLAGDALSLSLGLPLPASILPSVRRPVCLSVRVCVAPRCLTRTGR